MWFSYGGIRASGRFVTCILRVGYFCTPVAFPVIQTNKSRYDIHLTRRFVTVEQISDSDATASFSVTQIRALSWSSVEAAKHIKTSSWISQRNLRRISTLHQCATWNDAHIICCDRRNSFSDARLDFAKLSTPALSRAPLTTMHCRFVKFLYFSSRQFLDEIHIRSSDVASAIVTQSDCLTKSDVVHTN